MPPTHTPKQKWWSPSCAKCCALWRTCCKWRVQPAQNPAEPSRDGWGWWEGWKCCPQGLPRIQPFSAQGLPELNVGFLCLKTFCLGLLQSPLDLQTEEFPADWEGKGTEKRGCFCYHFGLLDATPFCQKECRSPSCKTPMAFSPEGPTTFTGFFLLKQAQILWSLRS